MPPEEERFDVRVLSAPHLTPEGEEFVPALARIFGVERTMAEHIARHTPLFVKRGVGLDVAEHLRATLERLGAGVVIQNETLGAVSETSAKSAGLPSGPSRVARPPAWPPGLPPDSPQVPWAPRASLPPERAHPSPPPRKSMQGSWRPSAMEEVRARVPEADHETVDPRAAGLTSPPAPRRPSSSGSLRPTAPPTVRAWIPLPTPPPKRARAVGTGTALLGAATALALVLVGATHWLRQLEDTQSLGNTPNEEVPGATRFGLTLRGGGLTGPGIEEDKRAELTLIVAWRTGCLSDDYRTFLQGLADAHRGELAVIGAGLAIAAAPNTLTLGKAPLPPPPPETWPPRDCEPGFELLPTDRGYVSDALSPPATYLYDADGGLVAAWRGGMSPQQRDRLKAWLAQRRRWW